MTHADSAVKPVHIIGGGLAGSEAAWQIARAGVPAVLHEMRPVRGTDAHKTGALAELVCSNSFRSDDAEANAVGVLHAEMRRAESLIMRAGDAHRVPAGSALAVDREGFSAAVTEALEAHPLVTVERGEIAGLPDADWDSVIIAAGPLMSPALSAAVQEITGEDALAFFDAIAPVVHFDSVDMSKAWFQSRYDKGGGADYINCALDRETYHAFVQALLDGDKTEFKEWEQSTPYFEGCLPVEIMAARGPETLAHGPMKPVGLTNPHAPDARPYAVAQLRQDNALGTLYNMVGFQTKLKHAEQARVLRMIPGLENAEFARLGGLHRNTFMNAPRLLDESLRLKAMPRLRFAGQITGCEGYVESAAVGLMAGRFAAAERLSAAPAAAPAAALPPAPPAAPPAATAMGALLRHITGGAEAETYQPMNINFGLFPPPDETDARGRPVRGRERKKALALRALRDIEPWAKAGAGGGAATGGATGADLAARAAPVYG